MAAARRRRRPRFDAGEESREFSLHWAPKWRRLLRSVVGPGGALPPKDFTEFDRTVRGMLNRISTENARRLLPLEPSLRGAEMAAAAGDSLPWWAARFAALMLSSYAQVIHTNRFARGLAARSADNVLPEYLDAVGPLLVQSPRLVTALVAQIATQLGMHDLCWPTARLVLLAAREDRDRDALPQCSLGRLPPDILRGRVLSFIMPPPLTVVEDSPDSALTSFICEQEDDVEERRKDMVAVLAHLVMFSPAKLWPRLSAFSFALAEAALASLAGGRRGGGGEEEDSSRVYVAASMLVTVAQRLEARVGLSSPEELRRLQVEDLGPLSRLTELLRDAAEDRGKPPASLSAFVGCRTQVALEHARRVQDTFQREVFETAKEMTVS